MFNKLNFDLEVFTTTFHNSMNSTEYYYFNTLNKNEKIAFG